MIRRQSPSSINTYIQCPRKYYFVYELKLPTRPSIYLVRGSVAHLALEHLFELEPAGIAQTYKKDLQVMILTLLKKYWEEAKEDFDILKMKEEDMQKYYQETQFMLLNWISQFTKKLTALIDSGKEFIDAWHEIKPKTEILYEDEELNIRGYIDCIEEGNGKVRLMDYKTSKKAHISDAYKLQLGMYALMYERKHGKKPEYVGIYFLKDTEHLLRVDDDLIKNALFHIEQIHASTETSDIDDYPLKKSGLCKWSAGQCDFYDYCFGGKAIPKRNENPVDRDKKNRKNIKNKKEI